MDPTLLVQRMKWKALKQVKAQRLATFLAELQSDFCMNVPVGGVWERQIRLVRSVLSSVLAQSTGRLDDASLRTFFYKAMSIVNSCPLKRPPLWCKSLPKDFRHLPCVVCSLLMQRDRNKKSAATRFTLKWRCFELSLNLKLSVITESALSSSLLLGYGDDPWSKDCRHVASSSHCVKISIVFVGRWIFIFWTRVDVD